MAIVPIALLTIIGIQNDYGLNIHLYGCIVAVGRLMYCIMEELGWRGYLEEEFKFIKPFRDICYSLDDDHHLLGKRKKVKKTENNIQNI